MTSRLKAVLGLLVAVAFIGVCAWTQYRDRGGQLRRVAFLDDLPEPLAVAIDELVEEDGGYQGVTLLALDTGAVKARRTIPRSLRYAGHTARRLWFQSENNDLVGFDLASLEERDSRRVMVVHIRRANPGMKEIYSLAVDDAGGRLHVVDRGGAAWWVDAATLAATPAATDVPPDRPALPAGLEPVAAGTLASGHAARAPAGLGRGGLVTDAATGRLLELAEPESALALGEQGGAWLLARVGTDEKSLWSLTQAQAGVRRGRVLFARRWQDRVLVFLQGSAPRGLFRASDPSWLLAVDAGTGKLLWKARF